MIVVDLSEQQALDSDPKAIQQINFTANLYRADNTRNYLRLFTRNFKSFMNAIPFSAASLNYLIFINIKWHNETI